ncbi:MAG: citrate lyase holo-[acyl-carrier protein] synthase [Candidatus Thiodiazotropha sp.]
MSYAKLQSEILLARDIREQVLSAYLKTIGNTLVFISTAVPGRDKAPIGISSLFHWTLSEVEKRFSSVVWQTDLAHDVLGPYILFSTQHDPDETKRFCIEIEETHPAARLMDLDVYSGPTQRLGRENISFPPRRCLLCDDVATHCIRTRRHDSEKLYAHTTRLLNNFRDTAIGWSAG